MSRHSSRRVLLLFAVLAAPIAGDALAAPDFSGLWVIADPEQVVRPEADETRLTPAARERIAYYKRTFDTAKEDPAQFCVPNGMPWTMLSRARGYVLDIQQTTARITLIFEYMDAHRLVHFGSGGAPANFSPSTQGYSVARWDGETLVVTTTALKARNPATVLQRSRQAQVVERWNLVKDGEHGRAIEMDLTVSDPEVYTQPVAAHQRFVPAPADTALNTYGCADSLYDDHIRELDRQRKAGRPAG